MTREEYIDSLKLLANETDTFIDEKAHELFNRLKPILKDEDKEVFKDLIESLPKPDQVAIKWFVPKDWLLNEQFFEFLWQWKSMTESINEEQHE